MQGLAKCAALGLLLALGAQATPFTRQSPEECVDTDEEVNLVELVGALNDTIACGPAASCSLTVRPSACCLGGVY